MDSYSVLDLVHQHAYHDELPHCIFTADGLIVVSLWAADAGHDSRGGVCGGLGWVTGTLSVLTVLSSIISSRLPYPIP